MQEGNLKMLLLIKSGYYIVPNSSTALIKGLPTEDGTLFKKIWAAAALVDPQYHELIVKTHMDFIESGSQIISTNSYATQPNYYMSAFEKEDYMRLMCEHAKVRKTCYLPNFLSTSNLTYLFLIIRIVLQIHKFPYNNQSIIIFSEYKIS